MTKEVDLKQFLQSYRNKFVDFFRFPGNYGDSLIWHGTKILLASLNIREKYIDISSPRYNSTLLIDGGGNFVDYYFDVRNFLLKKPSLYDRLAILYIKLYAIKDLIPLIKEGDLKKEYEEKESIVRGQLNNLGKFLDLYLIKLKKRGIFFEIHQPVKIYNDDRIKKYIKSL